ncbi:MAG: hypothetical protein PHF63_00490 [Herbinix sp.]|nr:hypothetical protein [Herbinix sp.]
MKKFNKSFAKAVNNSIRRVANDRIEYPVDYVTMVLMNPSWVIGAIGALYVPMLLLFIL